MRIQPQPRSNCTFRKAVFFKKLRFEPRNASSHSFTESHGFLRLASYPGQAFLSPQPLAPRRVKRWRLGGRGRGREAGHPEPGFFPRLPPAAHLAAPSARSAWPGAPAASGRAWLSRRAPKRPSFPRSSSSSDDSGAHVSCWAALAKRGVGGRFSEVSAAGVPLRSLALSNGWLLRTEAVHWECFLGGPSAGHAGAAGTGKEFPAS